MIGAYAIDREDVRQSMKVIQQVAEEAEKKIEHFHSIFVQ